MAVYDLLVIVHIIGTVPGVGAATFAEIHYTRFNSDDIITDDERKTLAVTYTVMRTGLFLLVISGFGFLDRKSTRLNSSHSSISYSLFFFFKEPAPTEIYPLPLHDALPISSARPLRSPTPSCGQDSFSSSFRGSGSCSTCASPSTPTSSRAQHSWPR